MPSLAPLRTFLPLGVSLSLAITLGSHRLAGEGERASILDRDGIILATQHENGIRHYPLGADAAHLIGYVLPGEKEADPVRGITGLEGSLDDRLRDEAKPVRLTIDANLQRRVAAILQDYGIPGAAIVQDPGSGEILALTSWPSYDANLFPRGIDRDQFNKLNRDPEAPFLNRAIHATPPGSIAKVVAGLAVASAKLTELKFHCTGKVMFDKISLRDWKIDRDEDMELRAALENSANTYFYQVVRRLGSEPLLAMAETLRIGEDSPLPLKVDRSVWLSKAAPKPIDLAMASIGQGDAKFTPIDVSCITSAVGTGTYRLPKLISSPKPAESFSLADKGIPALGLSHVQTGLYDAVNGPKSTARLARVRGLTIAGKTGTAQTAVRGGRSHIAWFTGYAPAKAPKHTVTILLQGPDQSGGRSAAPLAARIFQVILAK